MIALPTTGGITTAIIKKVVMFLKRLASQPVESIVVMAITDAGKVTSVVSKLVKPKLFKARLPKLPVPPLGI
jgi:hypothetical protein